MKRFHPDYRFVMFRDGSSGMYIIRLYGGACITGDPTAYIIRDGEMIWVRPGESVEFVEA